MKRIITCILIISMLVFGGCSNDGQIMDGEDMLRSTPSEQNTYEQITQEKAREMMKIEGSVIVDVRTEEEFASGHIPNAVCIPNETITVSPPAELPDMDSIILIYCRSGNRSKQASQKLADMGYTHIYEFGGINDWTGDVVTEEVSSEIPDALIEIDVGSEVFYAVPENNSSAKAFVEKLKDEPLTIVLDDYGGFEKVGALPYDLPRNDAQITTQPGDVILYQGDNITIYYDENTWSFTKLAHIDNVTKEGLLKVFGSGSITVTFSLSE